MRQGNVLTPKETRIPKNFGLDMDKATVAKSEGGPNSNLSKRSG